MDYTYPPPDMERAIMEKMQADMQGQAQQAATSSYYGIGSPEPSQLPLQERIRIARGRAHAYEARLGELAHLLDKNPEIARILDLMEYIRN